MSQHIKSSKDRFIYSPVQKTFFIVPESHLGTGGEVGIGCHFPHCLLNSTNVSRQVLQCGNSRTFHVQATLAHKESRLALLITKMYTTAVDQNVLHSWKPITAADNVCQVAVELSKSLLSRSNLAKVCYQVCFVTSRAAAG